MEGGLSDRTSQHGVKSIFMRLTNSTKIYFKKGSVCTKNASFAIAVAELIVARVSEERVK